MATTVEWRLAYAAQAHADLQARDVLLQFPQLPACHQLHYLQMACEKICKAYLCGTGARSEVLRRSHAHVQRPLFEIARRQLMRGRNQQSRRALEAIKKLARRIELLAPSVDDDGAVPSNCEYPWVDAGGRLQVPARFDFGIDLLTDSVGPLLLNVLRRAADELRLAEGNRHEQRD